MIFEIFQNFFRNFRILYTNLFVICFRGRFVLQKMEWFLTDVLRNAGIAELIGAIASGADIRWTTPRWRGYGSCATVRAGTTGSAAILSRRPIAGPPRCSLRKRNWPKTVKQDRAKIFRRDRAKIRMEALRRPKSANTYTRSFQQKTITCPCLWT